MWDSTESQDKAINLAPLLANSGYNLATLPNSVVQTGVKSNLYIHIIYDIYKIYI